MITFQVRDSAGQERSIEVPEEINLNLMEVLKASDYPIAATCGGIALCATCYLEVEKGLDQLDEPTAAELDMLDTLPAANSRSRLACQIKISHRLENALFILKDFTF
jgi:2Fe-2S ferredoxin